MNQKIHLLIPMSGQGTRYQKAGYSVPKPLIEVNGTPMIERLLKEFPEYWQAHFVLAENHRNTTLPDLLKKLRPSSTLTYVPIHSQGPGHAIQAALSQIPSHEAVFVSYCDYSMVWDSRHFEKLVQNTGCDSCVVCYRGFHAHYLSPQTYAYCRMDGERVVEIKEKGSFTSNRENEFASSGGYYFKTAKILQEALEYQSKKQLVHQGESYTSLTVQALIQMLPSADIRVFEIPYFFQWGTPEDLKNFEFWEKSYQAFLKAQNHSLEVDQVLMPMAGLGSRFQSMTHLPKPFIPIDGVPMFVSALASLPTAKTTVVVTHQSISNQAAKLAGPQVKMTSLPSTPSGQALSTEAGLNALNSKQEVLVSSCDHGIVLNPDLWNKFRSNPDCDAAIFTIQGFPGCARKPQAFAYVVPQNKDDLPLVRSVSVKVPVSDRPENDPLLVGTFWFRSADLLNQSIQTLKKADIRVNGELYLDSVFEMMMRQGLRVRMIPLDGYLCWGDPDSLAEALYWYEVWTQKQIESAPRRRLPGVPTL